MSHEACLPGRCVHSKDASKCSKYVGSPSVDVDPNRTVGAGGSEQVFPSTTWTWKQVIVRPPRQGQKGSAAKRHRWWGLPKRNMRKPLGITLSYRGGPEGWVEVHARGRQAVFHGSVAILDLLREISQDDWWV